MDNDNSDSDELDGGPLAKYLQEIGHPFSEPASLRDCSSKIPKGVALERQRHIKQYCFNWICKIGQVFKKIFVDWSCVVSVALFHFGPDLKARCQQYLLTLSRSRLLSEESDRNLVNCLCKLNGSRRYAVKTSFTSSAVFIRFPNFGVHLCFGLLISITLGSLWNKLGFSPFTMLCLACLFALTTVYVYAGLLYYRLRSLQSALHQYLNEQASFDALCSRAFKYLRHREMIMFGYLTVSNFTPVVDRNLSQRQQLTTTGAADCPQLRKALFHSVSSVLQSVREGALHLCSLIKENDGINDNESDVLCYLQIESCLCIADLSVLLPNQDGLSHLGVLSLQQVPEQVSLSLLKSVNCLLREQLSEFLALSAIFLYQKLLAQPISLWQAFFQRHSALKLLNSHFKELLHSLRPVHENLERSLSLHATTLDPSDRNGSIEYNQFQPMGVDLSTLSCDSIGEYEPQNATAGTKLFNELNSVCLHLSLAFRQCRQLLEARFCEGLHLSPADSSCPGQLQQELKLLQQQLKMALVCVDEAQNVLIGSSKTFDQSQQTTEDAAVRFIKTNNSEAPPIAEGVETEHEDRVFEAVACHSDSNDAALEQSGSPEEQRKDAAVVASKVLLELKSVLSMRSKEMCERERKALLKWNKYGATTDSSHAGHVSSDSECCKTSLPERLSMPVALQITTHCSNSKQTMLLATDNALPKKTCESAEELQKWTSKDEAANEEHSFMKNKFSSNLSVLIAQRAKLIGSSVNDSIIE